MTKRQIAILKAIVEADRWLTRAEISRAVDLDKRPARLGEHDVMLLQRLVGDGFISARQVPSETPIGTRWEYSALPPGRQAVEGMGHETAI